MINHTNHSIINNFFVSLRSFLLFCFVYNVFFFIFPVFVLEYKLKHQPESCTYGKITGGGKNGGKNKTEKW